MWQAILGAVIAALLTVSPSAGTPAATPDTTPDTTSGTSESVDVRRFWVTDAHRYTSPWYAGAHRKMIGFGCTAAPYYSPDPRCRGHRGFHHGLDLAMPCGTRLLAGFRGRVVRPSSAGSPGPSYGRKAFRIRNQRKGVDVVIGHARRVYVGPGDRVRAGQLVARASDAGAPDGCHLHFEVRPVGGGYRSAVRPHEYLRLRDDR
ncbi:MAG TPA: M23 family metallopeptidase [Nocardioidaceae bacterium]|nr:M23 family metallopeptidase [Nocardioidaceae bacterium]